jgi:very-short-patch-repair endonuclease
MNIPFERSFASHEKSQFWSKKNTEKPQNVFKCSHKKFWFDCSSCNHSFDTNLYHVVGGCWCPFCSGNKLCNETECITCFEKSFASHEKSKYWSNKNTEKPRNVFKSSDKKFWFDCSSCNHSFDTNLYRIVNGIWCPYCSNPPKQLCTEKECIQCFEKSFASHEKSKYWSSKNTEKPRNVFKSSNKKFWFDCIDCNHAFDSSLGNIVGRRWCPYCSNPPKQLCNETECIQCFEKSFASHEKSKYWSTKNIVNPRNIFKLTHVKFWFDCPVCKHTFYSQLSHIVNERWCPFCKNKTETKLYEKILTTHSSLIRQFRQDWCKNKNPLPYDFCIPEYKIIIELDGVQHFQQVSNWSSPEEQFENDKFKEECANNNGYSVIRLLQEDVMNDTYDWVKELCDAIEEIKSSNEITNVYLSKNNEYDNF